LYSNAGWDLCDGCRLGKIKIEELTEEQLPEFMRKMSVPERKAYVEKMTQQRQEIQQQIQQLSQQRDSYITEQRQKLAAAAPADATLDAAIVEAARTQAEQKDFQVEK
jgi:hypothetical protein